MVRTVPEKNTAWPNDQFGSTVKLLIAEMPLLFASIILDINDSNSESEKLKENLEFNINSNKKMQ